MSKQPPGWVTATLADVTEYISRGKSPKYTHHSSLPVVNQRAIRWFGIQQEHLKYIDPAQFDLWTPERFIRIGDILWNSTGTGTIGRACLVTQRDVEPPKVVDSHVTIVRPNQLAIEPRFLFFWIQSPEIQENISHSDPVAAAGWYAKSLRWPGRRWESAKGIAASLLAWANPRRDEPAPENAVVNR